MYGGRLFLRRRSPRASRPGGGAPRAPASSLRRAGRARPRGRGPPAPWMRTGPSVSGRRRGGDGCRRRTGTGGAAARSSRAAAGSGGASGRRRGAGSCGTAPASCLEITFESRPRLAAGGAAGDAARRGAASPGDRSASGDSSGPVAGRCDRLRTPHTPWLEREHRRHTGGIRDPPVRWRHPEGSRPRPPEAAACARALRPQGGEQPVRFRVWRERIGVAYRPGKRTGQIAKGVMKILGRPRSGHIVGPRMLDHLRSWAFLR